MQGEWRVAGIYELTAADRRLCLDTTGGPAPDGFDSAGGRALQRLVRA